MTKDTCGQNCHMTAEEAISYIENYGTSATKLGLSRTRELLALLGDPQKKLKFIHVAGSNGKGSACAMFDAVLRKAGYKCGLYTSPHIEDFCERIRINGHNIEGEDLARITERVLGLARQMEDKPTEFELVTAIAMQYYYEQSADIIVLEVGLGGELDSTNVIDAPELACMTNIGLEHTEYLGNTLEEIARTKAGIIKPGCSCVCYDGAAEVTHVIETLCRQRQVLFTKADFSRLTFLSGNLEGQRFLWKDDHGSEEYELALAGAHQLHNVALVLTGLEVLKQKGWRIRTEDIRAGLKEVQWPARMEILCKDPVVILDGGHNPQCAEALTESLKTLLPGQKVIFLAGVLKDKDYPGICDLMEPYAKEFVCVTPISERALSGEAFADYLKERGIRACAAESIEKGVTLAVLKALQADDGTALVIFGSLYLAGTARKVFHKAYRAALRKWKIKERDSISPEERTRRSLEIVKQIQASEIYQNAQTILIYDAVRGEVSLEALKEPAQKAGKRLLYPRCMDGEHMEAFLPKDAESFEEGVFGIKEPVPERSQLIDPEEIDLVLCPGTVFDEQLNRIGMGAGYYDRYLKRCTNATICAVSFEAQIVKELPADAWDIPMERLFTEARVLTR